MTARLPDRTFWAGRRVFLTGHTGFKGSWCALWLKHLGAEVSGYALAPDTSPAIFEILKGAGVVHSTIADIADLEALGRAIEKADPQIVLHMAAQPIVRRAIADPVSTFLTNVQGTVHVLEAARSAPGLEAVLVVTSDKVYANSEDGRAFREDDRLGGKDPYSASKAAAELTVAAMAKSYFAPRGIAVATARGGNVIGGGDFAPDRIVPDIVRAIGSGERLVLRHPEATRPWQHVLDCLSGYLVFAEGMARKECVPPALNFGPAAGAGLTVADVARAVLAALGQKPDWEHRPEPGSIEMTALAVDATLARSSLGWQERLGGTEAIQWTGDWYRSHLAGEDMAAFTRSQIGRYCELGATS